VPALAWLDSGQFRSKNSPFIEWRFSRLSLMGNHALIILTQGVPSLEATDALFAYRNLSRELRLNDWLPVDLVLNLATLIPLCSIAQGTGVIWRLSRHLGFFTRMAGEVINKPCLS
jgi:hypothetical protein